MFNYSSDLHEAVTRVIGIGGGGGNIIDHLTCIIHKATGEISSYVFIYSVSREYMFNSKMTDCLFDTRSHYR